MAMYPESVPPRTAASVTEWARRLGKVLVLVGLLPLLILFGSLYLLWSLILSTAIWLTWGRRRALFVYSNSPIWHDYLEQHVLPRIAEHCRILNWSERASWNGASLAVIAFDHFAGSRDFNPVVMVFRPFRPVSVFRYYQPFRKFKLGDPRPVEALNRKVFEALGT